MRSTESLSLKICLPRHAFSLDMLCAWSAVENVRFVGQKAGRKSSFNPGLA